MGRDRDGDETPKGQPHRKWLKPRVFFNTAARETIRAKLAAYKADYGGRGNPWLADRIADKLPDGFVVDDVTYRRRAQFLPDGEIINIQSFRKSVHRFMKGRIRVDDEFMELIAPFANSLPYHPTPASTGSRLRIELAINDRAEAIVFHSQPFPHELSWLEFELDSNRLTFVMQEGANRDFAIAVRTDLARYMQNAFRVLMVLMDEEDGDPIEGGYVPIRILRTPPIEPEPDGSAR